MKEKGVFHAEPSKKSKTGKRLRKEGSKKRRRTMRGQEESNKKT